MGKNASKNVWDGNVNDIKGLSEMHKSWSDAIRNFVSVFSPKLNPDRYFDTDRCDIELKADTIIPLITLQCVSHCTLQTH